MSVRLFLSYARLDDELFVRKLYDGMTAAGFDVWFDRVSMPSRQLTFSAEIQAAISACDRLVLIVGPAAVSSDYVTHEWRFAFHEALKCVNPILRRGDYELLPEDLRGPHVEDFRNDTAFHLHLANLVRQLSEAIPPLGKLVAVPALPAHYLEQADRISALRAMVIADLRKPIVVSGASGRVGLHGMGGIGKSLLANALARRPEIRREFPDGVFWGTLGQQPLIVELQRNIAKELGDNAVFTTPEKGRERLRKLLNDRAALLILDDAWHRDHAEAFNVIGPRCRLLLTTRDAGLVTALAAKENHYQVQLPTAAEARAMLAKAAGIGNLDSLPSDATSVIEECDRLPLALALCGGMIYGATSWSDLLEALDNHDLKFLSQAHPDEEQHANVWKTINVSVSALSEDERQRFAELAVFPLDTRAPETAVEMLWEHTAGLRARDARKLLRSFAARSLLRSDGGRIILHDLIHDFATGMTAFPASLHQTLVDAYSRKCPSGWPTGPDDGYFHTHLRIHLKKAGRGAELPALVSDRLWLEAKAGGGMVVDLLKDFDEALDAAIGDDEALRFLRLVKEALRREMSFLAKHPEALFQCLWNSCWWYDCPEAAAYYDPASGGWIDDGPPWQHTGLRLCDWMKSWREANERLGDFVWVRRIRPPRIPLGGALWAICTGHEDAVSTLAWSPEGQVLASASEDSTVRLWDPDSGTELGCLIGHSGSVFVLAWSPDGRVLASGSSDGTVRLWDREHRELARLATHRQQVTALKWSPDGRVLASAAYDGTVRLWDRQHREVACLTGHQEQDDVEFLGPGVVNTLAWSPDGSVLASGGNDYMVRLWDWEYRELACLAGHNGGVKYLAWSPDGQVLASAADDGTVLLWDRNTGRELARPGERGLLCGPLAWSPDGSVLASAWGLWDRESARPLASVAEHTGKVTWMVQPPDRPALIGATVDGRLRLWNSDRNSELADFVKREGWLTSMAWSPDGRLLATGDRDNVVRLWDREGCLKFARLKGHQGRVWASAWSPDGTVFASGSEDSTIRLWDSESGREIACFTGHTQSVEALAWSPDGRLLASAARESPDYPILFWDLKSGREVARIAARRPAGKLSWSSDGLLLKSSWWDGGDLVWHVHTGRRMTEPELQQPMPCFDSKSAPTRLTVEIRDGITVFSVARTGTIMTYYPGDLRPLHTIDGRRWAGTLDSELVLLSLEGVQDEPENLSHT